MAETKSRVLYAAISRILRPLIHILLRNGISYGTFADLAKWLFVDVATREFSIEGRKQTISRVSVITGLNRKEVKRVSELPVPDDQTSSERYNRAARVIAGWRRDRRFRVPGKDAPADLQISGAGSTFQTLVKDYSGDMPFRAVLDELIRVGAVVRSDDRVHLLARAYLPAGDETMKLYILGTDVAHLIATIQHNLNPDERGPLYQRKVMYDNLPDAVLPVFRRLSAESAQSLLEKLDQWLSDHDRDGQKEVQGEGRNIAGLGIYYFEEPYDEND